jgi:hypothetical protein
MAEGAGEKCAQEVIHSGVDDGDDEDDEDEDEDEVDEVEAVGERGIFEARQLLCNCLAQHL